MSSLCHRPDSPNLHLFVTLPHPIRVCARDCNNRDHTRSQMIAIGVTETTFFARLYLVLGLQKKCALSQLSLCIHNPTIHFTAISRFLCNVFPRMAPQFFWSARLLSTALRYSPDEPYYRLGPVHTCLYVRVRETGDWDIFLVPWNGRGRRLVELTDGCYSEGDSQGLPGFIHPRVLGIPTISFQ